MTLSTIALCTEERLHIPTEYPIWILLQPLGPQYPNTPRLTPLTVARGMAFTMGVEMVARSSRTNATKKRMVKGVAGRNIVTSYPPLCQTRRILPSRCVLTIMVCYLKVIGMGQWLGKPSWIGPCGIGRNYRMSVISTASLSHIGEQMKIREGDYGGWAMDGKEGFRKWQH